jgi:hypothetical protein
MQQFTNDVEEDLAGLKENLKASSRVAETFVNDLTNQAEHGKAKINTIFEAVSQDIKVILLHPSTLCNYTDRRQGVDVVIKSIFSSGNDVLQMFKLSMQTVLQGNAAMAAEQEQALAVATNSFQNRVGGLNVVVSETEASVLVIQDALVSCLRVHVYFV